MISPVSHDALLLGAYTNYCIGFILITVHAPVNTNYCEVFVYRPHSSTSSNHAMVN